MLTTYLHFPDGTQKAVQTPISYDTSGYVPSCSDALITAHIATQDAYDLYIDSYSLILKYKYITMTYSRFCIGRNNHPIASLDTYYGTERSHLLRLRDLRDELLTHYTVDGYGVGYRLEKILTGMEVLK
jgi:hypothetical protein